MIRGIWHDTKPTRAVYASGGPVSYYSAPKVRLFSKARRRAAGNEIRRILRRQRRRIRRSAWLKRLQRAIWITNRLGEL